jgi:hypothetical protein
MDADREALLNLTVEAKDNQIKVPKVLWKPLTKLSPLLNS